MSFSIRLSADLISLDPGGNTPVSVEIANRAEEKDRYEMEIEGLDPEWTAVPVPMFTVDPGETHNEKVFFKPPRVSESLAGTYPFVIKVRSLNSGESRTTQGVLQIKPYHHISMEVQPKKGMYSLTNKQNTFEITLMNLGNTEHTIKQIGTDPDDELAFDFSEEQVKVAPGQQKQVTVVVTPLNAGLLSSARLHGFSVTGRSLETPAVVTSAGAQLEQRPVLSPANFAILIVFFMIMLGWFLMRPQPPSLDAFSIDKTQVLPGDSVTISWQASHAKAVDVKFNGITVVGDAVTTGSSVYTVQTSGRFEAFASSDSKESSKRFADITVVPRPVPPEPKVLGFDIKPRSIAMGEPVTITYALGDGVVKATLMPLGQPVDPKLDTLQITPNQEGTQTYYLAVENAEGKVARSKEIKVSVKDLSTAKIIVFRADPKEVQLEVGQTVGKAKLIWEVAGAVYVELDDGSGRPIKVDPSGEKDVEPSKSTEYVLTAKDSENRPVVQKIRVVVKEAPIEPPITTTTGDPPPTTTGTTGETTGGTTGVTPATTGGRG